MYLGYFWRKRTCAGFIIACLYLHCRRRFNYQQQSFGNVITGLIPPLSWGLSQDRTWISNVIRGGFFPIQWFEMRVLLELLIIIFILFIKIDNNEISRLEIKSHESVSTIPMPFQCTFWFSLLTPKLCRVIDIITWLTLTEYLCNRLPRICSTRRKHFPVLSSFMTYHWLL